MRTPRLRKLVADATALRRECAQERTLFCKPGERHLCREWAGEKELALVGFDSNEQQRNAVENGSEIGFIAQNPYGMGYAAVTAGIRADQGLTVDSFVNTSYQWIDSSNLKDDKYSSYFYG